MDSQSVLKDLISPALEPYCDLKIRDSRILVYSGSYTLKNSSKSIIVTGDIFYTLYDEIKLKFYGKCPVSDSFKDITDSPVWISTPDGLSGSCITTMASEDSEAASYNGLVQELRPDSVECNRWHWSYLNMKKFVGSGVERFLQRARSISKDRLTFCCQDGTRIIMDNAVAMPDNQSPYSISHHCELLTANGATIDYDSVQKYILSFSHFISFVVGRYHSPFLIQGEDNCGNKYDYHFVGYDNCRIGVNCWLPFPRDKDIESLWPTFEAIWNGQDEDKADILSTAVHWYLEANIGSGKLEGALIMAITGVEMMWNVILDKNEKTSGKCLQSLLSKMKYTPQFDCESLMKARNQLTHYDDKNRNKYRTLTLEQKYSALENALNVLELAILYWLDYQGYYADRTEKSKWRGGTSTKIVPWSKNSNQL